MVTVRQTAFILFSRSESGHKTGPEIRTGKRLSSEWYDTSVYQQQSGQSGCETKAKDRIQLSRSQLDLRVWRLQILDVKLAKIIWDNFHDVIELELEEVQENYLPSNVFSIAESTLSPLFHPRAICSGDKVVGFTMYQLGEPGELDEDECTIWRFMIDRKHQNTGIGKIAMGLLLEEIKAHGLCKLVDIYYDPQNLAAKKLYASHGFKDVGERDDGDVIAERPI